MTNILYWLNPNSPIIASRDMATMTPDIYRSLFLRGITIYVNNLNDRWGEIIYSEVGNMKTVYWLEEVNPNVPAEILLHKLLTRD